MLDINFNKLQYFHCVASEGSIKAATKKLHVTQPTISQQIKQLEEELGYDLFERKHRRLELTPKGRALHKGADKIFSLAQDVLQSVGSDSAPERVRVGAIPSLPNSFIYDFTLKLWQNPKVSVSIVHADLRAMVKMLRDDELDLILSDQAYPGRSLRSFKLGSQPLVAVAHPKFAGMVHGFPDSIDRAPYLAFPSKSRLGEDLAYYFTLHGVKPQAIGAIDDITLLRLGAEHGLGFAIMPMVAAEESLGAGKLIALGTIASVSTDGWIITTREGSREASIRQAITAYVSREER